MDQSRPLLHHLAVLLGIGSSPIENDADQVLVLDHSWYVRGEHTAKTYLLLLLGAEE